MNNAEVARVFDDIASLLEPKRENIFKIRAYQKAARTIESLPLELEQVMREDKLKEVPGIGDAIARKITEILTTGHLEFYERLRKQSGERHG